MYNDIIPHSFKKDHSKKRSVSSLVATVILILLVVSAIVLIWLFVLPMMNQQIELQNACTNARLSIDTQSGYTCYDKATKKVNLIVARGYDTADLSGMLLGIKGSGQTVDYIVKNDPTVILSLNLDEGEGAKIVDSSGKRNNGRIFGSPIWSSGKYNLGLKFDQLNEYARVNESETLNVSQTGGVTIEAWIKIDSAKTSATPDVILGRG